jgi:20S proteasome alpha/beta subunit
MSSEKASDFKSVYAQAVNEAMSVLGEGSESITTFLEKKYSITLADTADSPRALSEALESAIDGGRRVIERRIIRLLYESINKKAPQAMTLDFEKLVADAKRQFNES